MIDCEPMKVPLGCTTWDQIAAHAGTPKVSGVVVVVRYQTTVEVYGKSWPTQRKLSSNKPERAMGMQPGDSLYLSSFRGDGALLYPFQEAEESSNSGPDGGAGGVLLGLPLALRRALAGDACQLGHAPARLSPCQ